MPALLLLRHAKSDWAADAGDDRARPLSRRGRKASAAMGRFIARSGNLRLPTAALVRIDFEADRWEDVGPGGGQLAWSVVPRLLG